jgi:hypothetical protein
VVDGGEEQEQRDGRTDGHLEHRLRRDALLDEDRVVGEVAGDDGSERSLLRTSMSTPARGGRAPPRR